MSWVAMSDREPRHGQWVVVPWDGGFKAGRYDCKHPFSPCIVDHHSGKFYHSFTHWKPLTSPKASS